MDSHNSSFYNNYTSERPDYDNYYSYENSNNDGGSVDEEEGGVDEEEGGVDEEEGGVDEEEGGVDEEEGGVDEEGRKQ
jgi:hypothetical protein